MKTLATLLLLTATIYAPATAYWTGSARYVTTVTGERAVSCEFSYAGQKFWKTFSGGTCPSSIEVR
mgnify:CR=1 FL=1